MFDDNRGARRTPKEEAKKIRQVISLLEAAIRECEQFLRSIEEKSM